MCACRITTGPPSSPPLRLMRLFPVWTSMGWTLPPGPCHHASSHSTISHISSRRCSLHLPETPAGASCHLKLTSDGRAAGLGFCRCAGAGKCSAAQGFPMRPQPTAARTFLDLQLLTQRLSSLAEASTLFCSLHASTRGSNLARSKCRLQHMRLLELEACSLQDLIATYHSPTDLRCHQLISLSSLDWLGEI